MPARSTRRNGRSRAQRLRVGEGRAEPEQPRQVYSTVASSYASCPNCRLNRATRPGAISWPIVTLTSAPTSPGSISRMSMPGLVRDRRDDRLGEEAGGEHAGARHELLLLRCGQLVGRRVEHDQRQDVRLVERRRAGQPQLRLLERSEDADARLDAGDHARHGHVDLRVQIAAEVDRARLERRRSRVPERRRCR